VQFCTVINKAWTAHARALAESLQAHEAGAQLAVLIVDPIDGFLDPAAESFELLEPAALELDDFDARAARYSTIELCTSLKPALIRHLLARGDDVVFLDSDTRVYASLDGLGAILDERAVALTPHLLQSLPDDGREPSEQAILLAGAFNTGLIACRPGASSDAVLAWWSERLRTHSRLDAAHGLVYEQRWADLVPGIFNAVALWRDPGVNAGYWRVASSHFERDGRRVTVDGEPLRLFHFTGFDPRQSDRLSLYDSRTLLSNEPVLAQLCADFSRTLEACGHAECSRWPYEFGAMASGAPLDAELRDLWDRAHRIGAVRATPFTADGEREFLDWLAEPEGDVAEEALDRYLTAIHAARADLRERFPNPTQADRASLLEWAQEQAERHPNEVLALLHSPTATTNRPGLHEIAAGEQLPTKRGEIVVCIPVYGAPELFAECLTSVLAHTPSDVAILIADDASPDPAIGDFVRSLGATLLHNVSYLRQPRNLGFPGNVNAAFVASGDADVVVLNSDCVVAEGWLEGLHRAAYSDALVATSSALTNHGTILSVPKRNHPQSGIPQEWDLAHVAGAVREQSLRGCPTLPTAIGHCMYIRRQALDLVGGFDLAFSPGYGEEVDFSQRCVLHGLRHVAADDVFVLHHAGGSFGDDGAANPVQKEHERIVEARYPYYRRATAAAAETDFGRLPRAIASARRAIEGFSVTIDGRCLGPLMTGTQVHTLQLIKALDAVGRIGVRVIVPPNLGSFAAGELAKRPGIELIPHSGVHPKMRKSDVAHRPYQVSDANDLLVLSCVGERQVVTHQDLIAYRNPGYFAGYPQWERHRRLTREALTLADRVVFFSRHALKDALSEDLLDAGRASVVYIGVDHNESAVDREQETVPPSVEALADEPFLLCLGTDFRHKNRMFALKLLEALRAEHDWHGRLVLAGPRVSEGSSVGEEAAYLATRPELASAVSTLPAVSEAEKAWLLEHCAAVAYPTTYEGFGLMPFEAADHGRPCLFASQTALAELLPSELATLVPWDPKASAARVASLLAHEDAIAAHVRAIRRAGAPLTWRSTAEALIEVYYVTAASPAREASRMAKELLVAEAERDELQRKYTELFESLTPEARTIVAPGGPLGPEEHRSLAAIVRRPLLRRLVLGPVRLAQRISHLGRAAPAPPVSPATSSETFELHFGASNLEHMREELAGDRSLLADEFQRVGVKPSAS
jgi:GT2 family glycosyltransferase/glycosyltransferase involved in cell wall biosynthesis